MKHYPTPQDWKDAYTEAPDDTFAALLRELMHNHAQWRTLGYPPPILALHLKILPAPRAEEEEGDSPRIAHTLSHAR